MTTLMASQSAMLLADPDFAALKRHLIASTGLTYYNERDAELSQHVLGRLARRQLPSCSAYLELLHSAADGETELDDLIKELTIGETYFFRHREMFDALENVVLPQLIQRNRARRSLRIWSAGCSVGAEAYSVSIALRRQFGPQIQDWNVQILGTDINRDFLMRAQAGCFEPWSMRSSPPWLTAECFTATDRGWQISAKYREGVTFQYHNLARHRFPSLVHGLFALDLILCRNVMIYFDQDMNRNIADGCWECLVDGGWLLVGHSEPSADLFHRFQHVSAPGAILYQKDETQTARAVAPSASPRASFAEPGGSASHRCDRRLAAHPAAPLHIPAKCPPARRKPSPKEPRSSAVAAGLDAVRRLTDRGELQTAAASCRELIGVDPLHPAANFFLAVILEQLGNYVEAQQRLRQTIYLDRDFALAHYHLGLVLQREGHGRQARRSFHNVLHLLAEKPHCQLLPPTDDLTAADLMELARMQLDRSEAP